MKAWHWIELHASQLLDSNISFQNEIKLHTFKVKTVLTCYIYKCTDWVILLHNSCEHKHAQWRIPILWWSKWFMPFCTLLFWQHYNRQLVSPVDPPCKAWLKGIHVFSECTNHITLGNSPDTEEKRHVLIAYSYLFLGQILSQCLKSLSMCFSHCSTSLHIFFAAL